MKSDGSRCERVLSSSFVNAGERGQERWVESRSLVGWKGVVANIKSHDHNDHSSIVVSCSYSFDPGSSQPAAVSGNSESTSPANSFLTSYHKRS